MNIKPEFHHEYTNLQRNDILDAYEKGHTITGIVEGVMENQGTLKIRLGHNLFAHLPFSEVSIYPFRYSSRSNSPLPTNIRCLMHKKVRVKVTVITDTYIEVSRKKNMELALEEIKKRKKLPMYVTQVIARSVFGDIGEGICGKIYIKEISKCHIHHATESFKIGQTVDVAVLDVDEQNRINASYRQAFKPYNLEDYTPGQVIWCRVGDYIYVTNKSSYYVNVTPQVSGILCIDGHVHLDYGSCVECRVKAAKDQGLVLELIQQI